MIDILYIALGRPNSAKHRASLTCYSVASVDQLNGHSLILQVEVKCAAPIN